MTMLCHECLEAPQRAGELHSVVAIARKTGQAICVGCALRSMYAVLAIAVHPLLALLWTMMEGWDLQFSPSLL